MPFMIGATRWSRKAPTEQPARPGPSFWPKLSCQYDAGYRPVLAQCARFDASGNPIGKSYAVATCAYAPDDEVLSVTDDNQHTTRFAYDTLGRCSQVTDARNDVMQYGYDAGDNVISETSVEASDLSTALEQFSMSYTYDTQDRCVQSRDNVGNTSSCAYDSLDRVVSGTTPNHVLYGYTYDDLGRCTVAIGDVNGDGIPDDLAINTRNLTAWDDNSRCVSRTDANTNSTFYGYDSLNDRVAVTNADTTVSLFTYDGYGDVITNVDPNGTIVVRGYDKSHRLLRGQMTVHGVRAHHDLRELRLRRPLTAGRVKQRRLQQFVHL